MTWTICPGCNGSGMAGFQPRRCDNCDGEGGWYEGEGPEDRNEEELQDGR